MNTWTQPSLLDLINPEPEPANTWLGDFGEHRVHYTHSPDGPHGEIHGYCKQCDIRIPSASEWHWSGPGRMCSTFSETIAKLIDPETESDIFMRMNATHFPMEWDGTLFTCKCGDKLGRIALQNHVQNLPSELPDTYWQLVGRKPTILEEIFV